MVRQTLKRGLNAGKLNHARGSLFGRGPMRRHVRGCHFPTLIQFWTCNHLIVDVTFLLKEVSLLLAHSTFAAPGYHFDTVPDLSLHANRERLSDSAMEGFFAITEKWKLTAAQKSDLLGGLSKSSLHSLKIAPGTRTQDELTRISYIVGIYKALNMLLPEKLADSWITRDNDNPLFYGHSPLKYMVRSGIPGMQEVRRLLDATRGGK